MLGVHILALAAMLTPSRAQGPMSMSGAYGPYAMTREATGTSWQPDSTPHEGIHAMNGDWMLMTHGYADLIYDRQGGPRGGAKAFGTGMLMGMAQRPLGPGTLGLRSMVSLDPSMGAAGYPLLLQTGETADGRRPLIDRQHPHDLFMELAASYSVPVADEGSAFAYFGLPGEPALGPPAFMHRFSAMDNPEAPISHHWLDSTHIAYGVVTAGGTWRGWKVEGSAFKGREPDQNRWNLESPKLDSFSARLSWNPDPDWALQTSYGHLASPEQLEPDVNTGRFTASASKNSRWGAAFSQTTLAYGVNRNRPGRSTSAVLLESALRLSGRHTVLGRAEWVEKDELFESGPRLGETFDVSKLSLGYVYDLLPWGRSQWGAGVLGSIDVLPRSLRGSYGPLPGSVLLFLRAKLV
ncbi:MAG TPA: hypothetical protein VNI01_08100 [Elusimicrobiota bacterium]|jgi:hypothetical protein|nr:hypothetical protein [Elusimicrobiota bacterium]